MTTQSILIGIAVTWTVAWGIVGCVTTRKHSVAKMKGWARTQTLIIRYVSIFNLVCGLWLLYDVIQAVNYIDGR